MCGICGVIGIGSRDAGEAVTRRMMASMIHRGPDEDGILLAAPVAVGMRRLSIIDLPGGTQPVWNETETVAVVFNGEIYNFASLRGELEALGHRFRTHSDTETIVHAYEAWGERCVERLLGMFAFAIVEVPGGRGGRATRVFLARDRLGIKPLYYAHADGALVFASEVRVLLASGCISRSLSPQAISSYLLFGAVSEPLTLIEGICSLPPGHTLTIEAITPAAEPTPKSYWDFGRGLKNAAAQDGKQGSQSRTPARHVRELLEEAVATHLIADVPVGVFLSSGLDSTAIAALASRSRRGIHTFTVAFPDVEFSEAEKARRTAARLGTEHSELTLSGNEMVARLDEAVASFDQPSADGINTYFVSWAARQAGLKVALSGLGSDEIFGGYTSFHATAKAARMAALGGSLPRPLLAPVASLITSAGGGAASPDALRKVCAALLDPKLFPHPYFFTRLLFTPRALAPALKNGASRLADGAWQSWMAGSAAEVRAADGFTAVSWLELRSYLANVLLRDTDAMSMRHSLEVRVPFLHSPLVEYMLSLPESAKREGSRPKSLLIAALGDVLPEEIVAQKKRTFTFPWEKWLRGPLGRRVSAGLADWSSALEPQLGRDFALGIWHDFTRGRTSWSRPWSLYVLNEWAKRNLGETHMGSAERQGIVTVSRQ
ncbi:MAG TPA: asparagine synthase (glutamine-hydrolyzing) [Candidatus Baltobacteraceae bacterium]|nr:asparagine synthase (glutamine-hydrolyzing) [Candidatus Baltobacteraceae bacterium]